MNYGFEFLKFFIKKKYLLKYFLLDFNNRFLLLDF